MGRGGRGYGQGRRWVWVGEEVGMYMGGGGHEQGRK